MTRTILLLALFAPALSNAAPAAPELPGRAAEAGDLGIALAPKLALDLPPHGLGAAPLGALEVTYRLPALEGRVAVGLEASLAAPSKSGSLSDPRLAPGTSTGYDLSLRQISLALLGIYRAERAWRDLTPYGGLGPTVTFERARTTAFGATTTETEGRPGLLVVAGGEWRLWRGGPFLEARYHLTRVDFATTGVGAAGGFAVAAGYRLEL